MKLHSLCFLALFAPGTCVVAAAELPPAVNEAFATYTGLPSVLVPVLQQAQDKQSAARAAVALNQSLSDIYTAREKLHRIPPLTPEQTQRIRTVYGQRMREEWALFYEEVTRIRQANCFQSVELAQVFRLMCMMIEK